MQWEIHVLGDAAWVHFVINSVSSITGYGTLGAIGAMLGLLAMTFSGITSKGGPQLDVAWFAVAFVVFYAFFIPRADRVLITEVNPPSHLLQGRVYVVDNVPMGLAVVGTIVTKLGLALAQEYDTTFGRADDTERVLTGAVGANIRRISDLRMMQDLSFTDSSGDFGRNRKNMAYYMAGCTIPGVAMGHKTYEQIMAGTSSPAEGGGMTGLLERIKYAHPVRRTEFFEANGNMVVLDCEEAYDRLEAQMTGPNGLARGLGQALHERGRGSSADVAYNELAQTFAKFGYDAEDLQTFAAANVMHSVYLSAIMGDSVNRHNQSMLVMVEQAMAQRNMQFAAEESMFVALLRPSVSFFEALFYALAPIIAFLIPMGAMGMRLVGKYLMFTIWVVLYFPLLAIIGAFGDMQFAGAMEALKDVALTPHGSMMVLKEAQDTMGTVSLLAAAVPQLALAILMGGPVAMSALAGRMQGGDMVDEKVAAPSAASNSAFMAQGASYTGNPGTGVVENGAPLQSYSLQGSLSDTVSSSKSEQQQASEQFSSTISSTLGRLQQATNSSDYKTDASYRASIDDAISRGLALQQSLGRQQTDSATGEAGTSSTTSGALNAGGGGMMRAGGGAQTSDSQGGKVGDGTVLKYDKGSSDTAQETRALAESYAKGLSAVATVSGGTVVSAQDAESLQQQSSDVYSKTEAYQEASAAASSLTSSLSFNDSQIAGMVDDGAPVLGFANGDAALAAVYQGLPPSAQSYFQQTKAELEARGDFQGDASAAALWRTVTDGRDHVPMADRDELSKGAATMAQLIAGQSAGIPTGDPSSAQGVADGVASGAAWAAVNENGGLPGSGTSRGDVAARIDAAEAGAQATIAGSGAAIDARRNEAEAAPNGMLPQSDSQSGNFFSAGKEAVVEHREQSLDKAVEAIENRSPGSAAIADFTSLGQGVVQDMGRKAGAALDGRDQIAQTEGEILVAQDAFNAKVEEVRQLYPDKGWSEGEIQAVAAYQSMQDANQLTQEQMDVFLQNNSPSLEAEYLKMDQDATRAMREEAVKINIEGLPSEMLENR